MASSRKCCLFQWQEDGEKNRRDGAVEGWGGGWVEKWKKSDYVSPVGGIQWDHYYSLN